MFLVGVDPEVFVVNRESNKIVPAIGLIGGNKNFPRPVTNGALQEDNVMAEFNIEPASGLAMFKNNIDSVLGQLDSTLSATGHTYDRNFKTSHEFDAHELVHPQARQFGCDPDDNVYSMQQNETISPVQVGNIRMCGGHIHLGFDRPDRHPLLRTMAVKWMDIYVGAPLSLLDPDNIRRQFYGKAGNYRNKPYGIEYRTVSNYWLSHPKLIEFVYHNTINAMHMAEEIRRPESESGNLRPETIRHYIDAQDSELVKIIKRFGVTIPSIVKEIKK